MSFMPFDDHGESVGIAGMTVENGADRIEIYGRLTLDRDRNSLENARALKSVLDAVITRLQSERDLPERAPSGETSHPVKNPFA